MNRRQFIERTSLSTTGIIAAGSLTIAKAETMHSCDVFVYGSTPGGLAAAIEAARRGCKVILACPKTHPGGMTASGLCTTDAVRRHLFGGLVIEFIDGVRKDYLRELGENSPQWSLIRDGWFYEPSVAERVFERMLEKEAENLTVLRGHHLTATNGTNDRVTTATLESPDGT
ncbi:MAG: FAD-dependent oxidoreductase, partial [Verrucomicrobiales bacterium]|nr:FAD-dependent oxidoreductase [Verrucomicrobiales bacterium]